MSKKTADLVIRRAYEGGPSGLQLRLVIDHHATRQTHQRQHVGPLTRMTPTGSRKVIQPLSVSGDTT
jgi:hypothetical protein